MRISPINQNQNGFKAVNQKYYQWAKKEFQSGVGSYAELLTQLRYDVLWKDIHPQDGIDTVEAIKELTAKTDEFTESVLKTFRILLKE